MPKQTPGSSRTRLISNAIKYGPVIVEGVRRYGPVVREQFTENKDTIVDAVTQRPRRGEARRNALAHAASVVDGSAMQCFHQAKEYWVVFSGDDAIGVHPFTTVPYGELLRHSDLSRRVRPNDAAARGLVGRITQKVAPAPRRGGPQRYTGTGAGQQTSQRPAGGQVPPRHEEPIEGEII